MRLLIIFFIFVCTEMGEASRGSDSGSRRSGLRGLLVGPQAFPVEGRLLKPFVSDGCTIAIDDWSMSPAWKSCCVRHDISYWIGGTQAQKETADRQLHRCMSDKGYSRIAGIYLRAVMAFGLPKLRTSFRWGFGWNYERPYSPLKAEEIQQAEFWYGKDLKKLKTAAAKNRIRTYPFGGTADASLNPLNKQEIQIYNHLKRNLKKNQVVVSSRLVYFNLEQRRYAIRLSSCGDRELEYFFPKRSARDFKVSDFGGCFRQ